MSYQVLARQWRPRAFAELVGQQHVVRALSHALDSGRIHHAFLFSGTRGVGKTTIARILAKSLNCDTGTSSTPCGVCPTCVDIDEGRYPDLLEIDAASRTKVDDTRELLDNVVYAPSRGRFKVYLIDEVHMLSTSSFNALLKTLEEPPPHVKFLLATTDPQRLPVTVLSRCLQFNLRRLEEDEIAGQLERIVTAEKIDFDADALAQLARAGNGSMRDALSLLDQAISHGGGAIAGDDVRQMLGTLSRADVASLLESIADDDAAGLLAGIERAAVNAPDFLLVLDELATLVHRLQVGKYLPDQLAAWAKSELLLTRLDKKLDAPTLQLFYQLAIMGRRDLPLAPSPRAGFEMCLLRMLAFRPERALDAPESAAPRQTAAEGASKSAGARVDSGTAAALSVREPAAAMVATRVGHLANPAVASGSLPTQEGSPRPSRAPASVAAATQAAPVPAPPTLSTLDTAPAPTPAPTPRQVMQGLLDHAQWLDIPEVLGLRGAVKELAANSVLLSHAGDVIRLGLKPQQSHLRSELLARQLQQALIPRCGSEILVRLEVTEDVAERSTAATRANEATRQRQQDAEAAVAEDPLVRQLMQSFDARILPGSVKVQDTELRK